MGFGSIHRVVQLSRGSILEHFSSPLKRNPQPLAVTPRFPAPAPSLPASGNRWSTRVSVGLPVWPNISCKCNHTLGAFCDWFLWFSGTFSGCSVMCASAPRSRWVIPWHGYTVFVYPFVSWWAFELFPFLTLQDHTTLNINVQLLCGHVSAFPPWEEPSFRIVSGEMQWCPVC